MSDIIFNNPVFYCHDSNKYYLFCMDNCSNVDSFSLWKTLSQSVDLVNNILLLKENHIDDIEWYLKKPWNWYYLSRRSEITQEVINLLPDRPWDFYYLIKDRGINFPGINEVNNELILMSSIPPMFDTRKVFINGGTLFKESWREIEMIIETI